MNEYTNQTSSGNGSCNYNNLANYTPSMNVNSVMGNNVRQLESLQVPVFAPMTVNSLAGQSCGGYKQVSNAYSDPSVPTQYVNRSCR